MGFISLSFLASMLSKWLCLELPFFHPSSFFGLFFSYASHNSAVSLPKFCYDGCPHARVCLHFLTTKQRNEIVIK